MDIGKIIPKNFPLKITDPATGKYIGLTVELAPMSDPAFKAAQRSITDLALQRRSRGKFIKGDERDENGVLLLLTVIRDTKWEDDADKKPGAINGEQPPFSEKLVRDLLAVDWLRDQIEDGLSEQSNFFKV